MFVVCCQAEVSATSWSLAHSSPTDCGASLCVIKKPRERGHSPRWAAEPEKRPIEINFLSSHNYQCAVIGVAVTIQGGIDCDNLEVRKLLFILIELPKSWRMAEWMAHPSGRAVWGVSSAARLLGLRVRFWSGDWCLFVMSVVLLGRGLCDCPITRPEESYCVWCLSVTEELHRGVLGPLGLSSHEKRKIWIAAIYRLKR
jgi:hypothetical protein